MDILTFVVNLLFHFVQKKSICQIMSQGPEPESHGPAHISKFAERSEIKLYCQDLMRPMCELSLMI